MHCPDGSRCSKHRHPRRGHYLTSLWLQTLPPDKLAHTRFSPRSHRLFLGKSETAFEGAIQEILRQEIWQAQKFDEIGYMKENVSRMTTPERLLVPLIALVQELVQYGTRAIEALFRRIQVEELAELSQARILDEHLV